MAYLQPFALPGDTLADFRQKLEASGYQVPAGYRVEYAGESKERAESQSGMISVMGPLMVLMIGTIVLAFNSFRMAVVIALVAVQSIGLAMLTLWLFSYPMGFMAIVGTMGLVGLAINDSIVVLAALRADKQAAEGDPLAIARVVVGGTRHIISTTLTTVGGFLPLILWGGSFWSSLAVAIAGGLVGATLLALFFVPSAFALITRKKIKDTNKSCEITVPPVAEAA
jgi:multidrug efflux pump subunit AcrB